MPQVDAHLREPAVAPDPIAEDRIHDRADAAAIDHEGRELPSFRRASGRYRRGRVHEHHLEEEERERRRVIARALEQESLPAQASR